MARNGTKIDSGGPLGSGTMDDVRILIVEPDPERRVQAEAILLAAAFRNVVSMGNPDDAFSTIETANPDVLLLAMDLGATDGFEWLTRLSRHYEGFSASVIFATEDDREEARAAILERGGADYVTLPLDPVELASRMRNQARLRLLQRQMNEEKTQLESLINRRTRRLNDALNLLKDTERRLSENVANADAENREKTNYFAETHHEMRTPLNAICGMSDAMRLEMFGPISDKYKEYAGNIYQAGQHLLGIVDGRLELSRIEAGAEPLELEDVDVSGVIQETADMLGRVAETAKVALEVDIEPDLPVIETDKRKLRQIMLNLVSNAIKYTPENGRVMLTAKRNEADGVFVLVVSDTGIGMTAEDLHEVMKPYKRAGGGQRKDEQGTGLGLPIVIKLVELLGGVMEMRSKLGRGTSVRIELPMAVSGRGRIAETVA